MAAKKKVKKKKASVKASKKILTRINMGFSVDTKKEEAAIRAKARKYANGNVSKLIRHAVHTCKTHAHDGE